MMKALNVEELKAVWGGGGGSTVLGGVDKERKHWWYHPEVVHTTVQKLILKLL